MREELAARITSVIGDHLALDTAVPGLLVCRTTAPTAPTSFLYEPSFALVVCGKKRVLLGDRTYEYDSSSFLLTTMNVPTVTKVLTGSEEEPYISLLLRLDLEAAREIAMHVPLRADVTAPTAMATAPTTPELLSVVLRLVQLLDTPRDIPVLGDLLHRELLYRVLNSDAGGGLRQVLRLGTHGHRVARAVKWLRENYAAPLRIERLAKVAGLGVSTLHHQFRKMTGMSPLNFQKSLRLHHARHLMVGQELDAAEAATQVGYESASQFSREYRRLFGAPPRADIRRLSDSSGSRASATR